MKRLLTVSFIIFWYSNIYAQLDSIHYLPPMHPRVDWGPQYLYLSTPETTPFAVRLRDGSGNLIQTVNISNTQPFRYDIGSTDNTYAFVTDLDLHKALKNKGLIVESEKKFYAYFRAHSTNQAQASDLTCKGRAALGKTFRVGHLLQEVNASSRSNFVGILATEDSTEVIFSGFDPNTDFRKNGADVPSTGPERIVLQKGESVVFAQYLGSSAAIQPPNGFMGGLVTATKPIAINVGSWCGSPTTAGDKDTGIDQIVPVEATGKEYILCRGNGSAVLERPIIVAHYDNTQIFLNGGTSPTTVLNAGQFYAVQTSAFSADNNLYIRSSQKIYVYQMIGGAPAGNSNELRTEGLIFVPPISCSIPNSIDNIVDPNAVGSMLFDGGVMITAMRDSQVTVLVDGVAANLGAAGTVVGNPDFVTYRNISLFSSARKVSNISVKAQGAIQVAMYGQNSAASYAAFYSGFSKSKEPNITLKNIGDGICPDTLVTTGLYDGVQWRYEDSIVKYGKDTFLIISAPGRYIAEGYLGVCRKSETASDTLDITFRSPEFPYTSKQPSCYGFSDGQITFGIPNGGFPPYQFSIDNGQSFSRSNKYSNIKAGTYKLIVRDSLGCYNRPLEFKLGQPAIMSVEIVPISAFPSVIKVGQTVKLEGRPLRKTISAVWSPKDSSNCVNCLTYSISPIATTQVLLTVKDSMGCPASDTLMIYVQPNVFAPNVINPDSQNGNQAFTVYSKENLPMPRLSIYDRWGEHLFEAKNIETNNLDQGWDGTFRGKRVQQGVYVFYAEVEVLPGKTVILKGDITVLY
ncbi:MAG: gliding motility-associated C-terminal domain-containing protein [Saprospiraceae bacterium]|nr:gliding motility-associated C-terminal domain-containing protein [Saprospiraceae bacterium]